VSAWLAGDPGHRVVVRASTDKKGDPAYNADLSMRRARTVEQQLISGGIDGARVTVVGEGESGLTGAPPSAQRSATVMLCEGPAPAAPAAAATPPAEAAPQPAAPAETPPPAEEPIGPTAEATPEPEPAPTPYPSAAEQVPPAPTGLAAIGMGFSLGGGVMDFTDSEARALTQVGGSWEARLLIGTHTPAALELAYVGSAQGMDVAGLDTDTFLVGNGGEGALRLQLPVTFVRPYALIGLGWIHYSLTNNEVNNTALEDSDDVLTVPMGLGITLRAPFGGTFDVRGTFRAAYMDDLMTGIYGEQAQLHTWNVDARLGWEF
jgi:hypothetical protein